LFLKSNNASFKKNSDLINKPARSLLKE